MPSSAYIRPGRRQLKVYLLLFFLALGVPAAILVYQAFDQLKWQTVHQYRGLAGELMLRIDNRLRSLVRKESDRPFTDYAFLNLAGDPSANFVQRSALSAFPVTAEIPGTLGYFQVDADGVLSTPHLPPAGTDAASVGIDVDEFEQRQSLMRDIYQLLTANELIDERKLVDDVNGVALAASPSRDIGRSDSDDAPRSSAESIAVSPDTKLPKGQAAFDRLSTVTRTRQAEKTDSAAPRDAPQELDLEQLYDRVYEQRQNEEEAASPVAKAERRKEVAALPEAVQALEGNLSRNKKSKLMVNTFESEIDPLELSLLDSGHFVLHRKVWRDGQRFIQGLLIDADKFLLQVVDSEFSQSALAPMSDLRAAFGSSVLATFHGRSARDYSAADSKLSGMLIYKTALSEPFNNLQLFFSVNRLPLGLGASLIIWVSAVLVLILCGGLYVLYRLGSKQIELADQQQDFVAAVSHELKTPLTSIRMYGEMLREGWASDDKKREYYEYIHDESERLSRLINNVLQLAKMNRDDIEVRTESVPVASVFDQLESKIGGQVKNAGFTLNLDRSIPGDAFNVEIDPDLFLQVMINLIDNAIKFSSKSTQKQIDMAVGKDPAMACFMIRDYGPGVARDQMKKIFKLFYRSENELTRETVGTGIGLALVHQLVSAMRGRVDVVNMQPGAQFRVFVPLAVSAGRPTGRP